MPQARSRTLYAAQLSSRPFSWIRSARQYLNRTQDSLSVILGEIVLFVLWIGEQERQYPAAPRQVIDAPAPATLAHTPPGNSCLSGTPQSLDHRVDVGCRANLE